MPVTNVVLGRIVVSPVYLTKPGAVEVHGDGRFCCRISNPVNAPLLRQHGRGSIFLTPLELPGLPQAGMVWSRAVVVALVTFLLDGAYDATEGSPGRMVVDLCPSAWGPDEDLKGAGTHQAVVTISHVPVFGPSRLLDEWKHTRGQEAGISRQVGQNGNGIS